MEHQDWFHIILDTLYLENAFNNDFVHIHEQLKQHINNDPVEKSNDLNRINTACNRIVEAGFGEFDPKVNLGDGPGRIINNLDNTSIRAKLTLEGFKYILSVKSKKELDESIIRTNKSVISTNEKLVTINIKLEGHAKTQKKMSYAMAFFTLVAAFASAVTVWKACGENDTLKIQPLRMNQTQLDSSLRFQKGIDSVLKSMGKRDSLLFAKGRKTGTLKPTH